eukprot:TRINITY_DN30517_c0_g1_i1.p1 TRINITY_DN30517_c0_g1~~TRINITY_DN30517_c0_g1_i1.p1  ORF type:complete len:198 (+),score=5.34 TRINITY_DN30517_c0_g1_i1:69-662(+)
MGCTSAKEKETPYQPVSAETCGDSSPDCNPQADATVPARPPATIGQREIVPSRMRVSEGPFKGLVEYVIIQKPSAPVANVKLVDCFIDNASGDNGLESCELINCTLNNCTISGCTMERCSEVASCEIKRTKVKECTLKDKTKVWDSDLNLTIISAGCQVFDSTLGPAITTTGSDFTRCTGNPMPRPSPDCCHDCTWR